MTEDPDPRPVEIQVAVADQAWHDAIPKLARLVERVSSTALGHPRVHESHGRSPGPPWEVSILLADDEMVRQLNRTYRARDRATNVLSFAYRESAGDRDLDLPTLGQDPCLGDVALARETIVREAAAQGKALSDHLAHLLVHGVLHLCGFDHENEDEAREMERLEREILAGLGIGDPYQIPSAGHSML